jgi:hypothetical protein
MVARFDDLGIRFRDPDNWKLEQQANEDGWTVTVQSPETAFLVISLRDDSPDAADLAAAVLKTLKEEYEGLEAEEAVESVAGQPAVGHDIRFFSFDLTNSCWTRSFYTSAGTLLILCQLTDLESERHEPVLRAICASLEVAED